MMGFQDSERCLDGSGGHTGEISPSKDSVGSKRVYTAGDRDAKKVNYYRLEGGSFGGLSITNRLSS